MAKSINTVMEENLDERRLLMMKIYGFVITGLAIVGSVTTAKALKHKITR